ncbi:putative ATP-dependent RNA helicase TDRD12 [Amphibalanus amphitrite]|uniref:RNA helicase n=1 Tax=Amphibalanus amphitrite TaxID=1232801 RepID=A0A6A4WVZ9_AMPAM|nr:putative ATP-dependent RNA helicase TDRD12 [Amphibalanus amphitrite]
MSLPLLQACGGMAEPLVAPSPPQQQHENVNITQVFSPDEIWATPSFTSRFLYLEQEMVTTCAQQRHQLKAELRVRPGMVCVYHRAATDRWYRVRVLTRFRRSVGPCCQVQLLDYGEQQTVLDVDLYRLPEPYCDLNHLPAQAIRIRLAGLCPMQLGFVVSDQGAVLGTMEYVRGRASRWSEAACALVRRLLTPGTPCRLEWTRCSRAGVRHGRLRVLGDAEADIAQRLIAEQVAQARPEHEPSSSSECDEPSPVTEPAPLRHTEVVLDSDDSSEPDGPPPARPDTGAAAADSAVFWAEQRRAEEEFHRLQQLQRNETAGDSTDHDDKRSRLQRRLMGLLVPENASAGDQGTRPSVQPPPASQSPGVGVLSGTVRAPLMPGRGRGALTSPQIPAPGVRAPTTSPSPEPAETSGASDLAAALRQLRSESSSADEAGRPSPTLLPAGQTSSARMAAQRRAADEQRQRQYEARLQRRAGRAAPPERAETVRPSLWGDQLSPRNARPSPWDGQSGPYDPQPRSPDSQLSPQAAQTRPWDDQPSPRAAEPKPQDLQPRLQDSQPRQQATQPKPQTAQPRLTDAQLITQDAQPRPQAAQASLQDSLSSPRDVQPILKTAQPRPPAVQTRLGDAQSSPWDVQPKPQAAQSILKTTQPTQLRQAANAAPQAPQAGRADGLKSKVDAHQPIPNRLGPRTPPTAPGGPMGNSPLQENSPQSPAVSEQRRSTGRFERVSAAVWRQRLLRQAAGTRASADQSAAASPSQSATAPVPAEETKAEAGRPSLEHLMTSSGELRDRPAPPRPAADAVGRSDSALLRVLVHGRRRVAPYWRTEQMPFADMVMQKLRPMAFRPSRVQAYLWSAAACYRNIVCVGQAGSGKTLGYLLAVVNSLLDPDTYEAAPTGHGPLCLVLVPSWRRGRAVQELCHAVTDSLRCLPLLVHGGGAEAEQEVSLLNGCDLLVGTPACLLRLLRRGRDTFIQLSRVCHLVLDDADLLVEHSAQAVEQLALAVFSMWRARSEEALSLPQQVIAAASHWTPGLQALTRLLPDSVVATSCYLEQLVWARPRVFTHVLEDDQKEQKLLGLLQTGLHRHRLVVFTSTDESAQRLARLLHCQSYPVLLADGDQLGASLTELERCWRSSSGDAPDVLVVSDTVVAELTVRDAAVLVHFDVPTEKRTQLGLRCSYMMDSYPDRLVNPEAENRCVVHLFVSPSAAEKIGPYLPQLLVRLGAEVPPALAEAAQRRSGPRRLAALCDRLLAAGRCPDRLGCERRHWLHPTADAGQEDIPQVCHELPQVGDLCGLLWDDMFVRVQVTSLETGTETCAVLLVDFGNTETIQRARLLSLPAELAAVPPQAVTAHLCGVEPIDGDWEWTEGAVRLAEAHLKGQVAVGKVVLALGRHLWLSPLVRRRHHQLYQTSATLLDPSLASQLLERGFGQRAPRHLESLYELCRRAGLPLRDQWKPADRRKLYQTEFLPLVAPLKTNSSVNITNVTSPADFYVQRNDVFPQYEQLMADLNRWAEGPEPARLAAYRHRVRQHCVAQFPDDGRWYRARVLSVTTDEAADTVTYEVLYTDVGDRASVDESLVLPLPERFAKRLPLQAIRCELAFCSPTASDGVWSEEAGDLLYQLSLDDEELWIPYHCQVVGQTTGRHRVVLYDPQRRGVHQKLEEAGLATVDEQGLFDADPPEFPPSESSLAAGRSLDSDDSDSDSELRLAEQRAGVTYRDVLEVRTHNTYALRRLVITNEHIVY